MCIRDRLVGNRADGADGQAVTAEFAGEGEIPFGHDLVEACLLYTSDAADERSSVDLGGRRIIKKQKTKHTSRTESMLKPNEQ